MKELTNSRRIFYAYFYPEVWSILSKCEGEPNLYDAYVIIKCRNGYTL